MTTQCIEQVPNKDNDTEGTCRNKEDKERSESQTGNNQGV